jgi:hypothetical protein
VFVLLDQIPFVDHDHHGLSLVQYIAGNLRVLFVAPSAASIISTATSARRTAVSDRMTEYRSSESSSTRLFRRKPPYR